MLCSSLIRCASALFGKLELICNSYTQIFDLRSIYDVIYFTPLCALSLIGQPLTGGQAQWKVSLMRPGSDCLAVLLWVCTCYFDISSETLTWVAHAFC